MTRDLFGRNGTASVDMELPRISIVMPVLNQAASIERSMLSVLEQRYSDVDLIVMDGGSTDGTVEIIRRYSSRLAYWRSEADDGQYDAINKGMSKAHGDVVAWLNADDEYAPHALNIVAEIFANNPTVKWICGTPATRNDAGLMTEIGRNSAYPRCVIRAGLARPNVGVGWIQQESCFWRRELAEFAGPFPRDNKFANDFWLWMKYAEVADLVSVDGVLSAFTDRRGQVSRRQINEYMAEVDQIANENAQHAERTRMLLQCARVCSRSHLLTSMLHVLLKCGMGWDPLCYRAVERVNGQWQLTNRRLSRLSAWHGW